MILKPSILVNELSGTAKEVTARTVNNRQVISLKAKHTKRHSPTQNIRKAAFTTITKAYQKLTAAQHKGWADLAEQSQGKTILGEKAKLTAHNIFVRLNTNLALVKKAIITDAPELVPVPGVGYTDLWFTQERIIIDEIYPFTLDTSPTSEFVLVVKISPEQYHSCSNAWNKTTIFSTIAPSPLGELNLTQAFIDKFQKLPTLGSKYFLEMYWLDTTTGFTGQSARTVGQVQENSWHKNKPFTPLLILDNSTILMDDSTVEGQINFSPTGPLISGCLDIDFVGQANFRFGHITGDLVGKVLGGFGSLLRAPANVGRKMYTVDSSFGYPDTMDMYNIQNFAVGPWKLLINGKLL